MADNESKEPQPDFFENLLNLEDQYHSEGYDLGVTDGSRAGRIEGRIFGLEKGFEKFLEMGHLQGRAAIWDAGLSSPRSTHEDESPSVSQISKNERLNKHVSRLKDLIDMETLSTENNEDAVSEFDDRLKDARAKATLISKILGEDDTASAGTSARLGKQGLKLRGNDAEKKTNEMEDFTGLPQGKAARASR